MHLLQAFLRFLLLILFTIFLYGFVFSQELSNHRVKNVFISNDTVQIDNQAIVPFSEIIHINEEFIKPSSYEINYAEGLFIVKDASIKGKDIKITYKIIPVSFAESFEHKKMSVIESKDSMVMNPFHYEYTPAKDDIFYLNGLNKSGSISRGASFGNNQDLAVNSSLNLQLSGKISNNVNILASISDDNIPIQAEGNTQQLQDFDKVFIQLYDESWKLTAGDFFVRQPKSYFLNINKKAQGGSFEIALKPSRKDETKIITPFASAAVSKGKYARQSIIGVEGNQGPYRLRGNENETFIIVLSGTEKIYVDGKLLKRGTEHDYIIDYNTAELTFTPNFLITKDSRIVAEFDYSERNYSRTMFNFGTEYESQKLKLNFNYFSEQDVKNQPLLQDLTDNQKKLLSEIGDSLELAVVPNINQVAFNENLVLYKMVDTLGYDSVFVYSTNPDSAIYQLGFSQVGQNNGNYVLIQSTGNGRVYEWVEPIGGVPQGNYEPVILLVTPKKIEMTTFGGEYLFSEYSKISWEGAMSNNDINTFSSKDRGDDLGYAFKLKNENAVLLSKEKDDWKMNVGGGYEFLDKNFKGIGPFRNIEFQRDWNISSVVFTSNQHAASSYLGFEKSKILNIQYAINLLENANEYRGIKNIVAANVNFKGFRLVNNSSYLITEGLNNTEFIRNKSTLTKDISWFVLGVDNELEQNKFFFPQSDSLATNSFRFLIWKGFIHNADTSINKFLISYKQRIDDAANVTVFKPIARAEDVELSYALLKNKNHILRSSMIYRKLYILEPNLTTEKPDENILSRVEYNAHFLKSAITSNTFYQIGSGLEVKKEFSFVEVQPGQGTHTYLGDLNGNGASDLNEFEVAAFKDQANFIKIFTPTNEYVRTYTNEFNQGLFLNPETQWGTSHGLKKFIARFANRTNYRVNRKTADKTDYFNPFVGSINDSTLVTTNLGFLNTIFFNKTNTKWSMDYTYQDNQDKSLLTNGIESRRTIIRTFKTRWNITRTFTLQNLFSNGIKSNKSEFFNNQNYYLSNYETEPKIIFQPDVKFRWSLLFNYKEKYNSDLYGGEILKAQKLGTEVRYNIASKGSVMLNINLIKNQYSSPLNNTLISYEMLEGLLPGTNTTWEVVYQQNLSKHMQLSLNYNGRKSDETPIIHVGGVQVRAFF